MQPTLRLFLLWWLGGGLSLCAATDPFSGDHSSPSAFRPLLLLTNVAQLRSVSSLDLNRGCPLELTGTVTFVDTNRNLVVVQDATDAVALYPDQPIGAIQPGQRISVRGASASPYVVNYPDYPYRSAGRNIRSTFEAPSNWGNYYLNRMSGYLHPPVSGDYTFWIASDNSSELWLSTDENPARVRKIAYVKQGDWVNPHEWFRYASQRSATVSLLAGHSYYIEALHEQLTQDDHLAVAWEGPGLEQSVVDGNYLTPWIDDQSAAAPTGAYRDLAHGILREYWTNYCLGAVVALTSARPIDSGLVIRGTTLSVLGQGTLPEPRRVDLGQRMISGENFRRVKAEGILNFIGIAGDTATLELLTGQNRTLVQIAKWHGSLARPVQNWRVQVEGICEGASDASGQLMPGFIWAPDESSVTFIAPASTAANNLVSYTLPSSETNAILGGFFYARGVVTFSDRVFNQDSLFIQDVNAGVFVSQADRVLRPSPRVGQSVEIGGELLPGYTTSPAIHPLAVNVLGWHSLPEPIRPPPEIGLSGFRDSQWTELEGVVRAAPANGTILLMSRSGPLSVWIGQLNTNDAARLVDSTLRVRGVMSLRTQASPLLLVPSCSFVEVQEEAVVDPFSAPTRPIGRLKGVAAPSGWIHRTKVAGTVTYQDDDLFFLQDESGAACVQSREAKSVRVGDSVVVVGFPEAGSPVPTLKEALWQTTGAGRAWEPGKLDLNEGVAGIPNGSLVRAKATLLAQKIRGDVQVLELQAGQRVFEAVLSTGRGRLPSLAAGSLLEVTGVCLIELVSLPAGEKPAWENPSMASVQISLRSPSDVGVLSGVPWWTLKRVVALIGVLFIVLMGSLVRIQLLRRRFERQQTDQLAFSRQILQSQEGERRRIAANLHDSLGQNLLVIKNQARLALQPATGESQLRQRLDEISGVASQAIEEVRQITQDLRPYHLDRLGLTQAIRAVITRLSANSPILFASDVEDIDGVFNTESEIHLYRIIQEGISNVVKHSGGTEATVVIKRQANLVTLSIRDNGSGFDAGASGAASRTNAGFGLSGISERARILGGKLTIDSRPGEGVILTIEIPVGGTS